jgi:hypothetical protein
VKSELVEKLMKCSKLSAGWLFNLIDDVATTSLEDEPAALWRMLDLLDAVGSRIIYPLNEQSSNWVEHLIANNPFRQCNGNVGISDLVGLAASRGVSWYVAYKVYQGVDAEIPALSSLLHDCQNTKCSDSSDDEPLTGKSCRSE